MAASLPITVILILVVLASWVSSQMDKCFIDCRGFILGNSNTADPFDCHNYYVCNSATTWSPYPLSCPDGQDFDYLSHICSPAPVLCTPLCEKCSTSCAPEYINRAAHPGDCSIYDECDGNGAIVATHICGAEAPYFDGFTCQTDQGNCCSCKPQCTEFDASQHLMIAENANCTNYYLCLHAGVAEDMNHQHCPTGNFDQASQLCSNTAQCTAYSCSNLYGCVQELTCSEAGFFPKCTRACDPHYYYCSLSQINQPAELMTCTNSNVLQPLTMECVDPSDCPFPSTA